MANSRRSFLRNLGIGSAASVGLLSNFGLGLEEAVAVYPVVSAPSDLKITKISAAFCFESQRRMFVKVETNQGITGYGEGTDAVVGGYYLIKVFEKQLIGKNPLDIYRLFEDIRRINGANLFSGAQGGTYIGVLSGIEIALWDLAGKAIGVPVYRLLGGKFRDSIHMYTHPKENRGGPKIVAASCLEARNLGYDAIKFSVDFSVYTDAPIKQDIYNPTVNNKEIDRIMDTVSSVREAVGPDMAIMVEMHARYDVPTGVRIIKALEPFNPTWIEEPVPAENMDALREITQSSSIPICVGENLFLAHGFLSLLEKSATDIIMPDIQKCGGIGEAQSIAKLAHLHYVPFAPHMVSSPYGMMASAHLCSSVPNFYMLESNHTDLATGWTGILEEPPVIENSFLKVSDKPGIGLNLIEDGIRKIASPGIPFFA